MRIARTIGKQNNNPDIAVARMQRLGLRHAKS